jgi:hypothetical protein
MGFSMNGGNQPPAVDGLLQNLNPQIQAYLRARMPGMVAQQMGNAAPGLAGGAGLANGITKALLGGMSARRMKALPQQRFDPSSMQMAGVQGLNIQSPQAISGSE